jgi:acetyltransferase-like isoleucine patch superfamily enzyme
MLTEKPRVPIRDVLLFGLWPGFLKKVIYRVKGYRIGKGVSIGFGSVICADQVEIGEHASIGFLTILRGKEIHIGPHVQIGSTTFLDTPYIHIGEGSKINEQVFVGGLQFPDSRFVLGRNCQIMQMSFINPARSVIVGDDTGIGGHCLIFGHTSWLSQLEGYPVEFAPIEIGNNVSLAWRAFVLPGTRIGDGAVVGAGSVAHGTIPPRCLAVGFPARVISKFPDFPKELSERDRTEMFRKIVEEMVRFFHGSGLEYTQDGNRYEFARTARRWLRRKQRRWVLEVAEEVVSDAAEAAVPKAVDVLLCLHEIPDRIRHVLDARKVLWIDVARKERSHLSNELGEEVSLFLKRYGIRTLRAR